jgi:hypothetical protein
MEYFKRPQPRERKIQTKMKKSETGPRSATFYVGQFLCSLNYRNNNRSNSFTAGMKEAFIQPLRLNFYGKATLFSRKFRGCSNLPNSILHQRLFEWDDTPIHGITRV